MKKLVEVKEFDVITYNKAYKDSDQYVYLDEQSFSYLENLIFTFNESEEADGVDFFTVTTKRHIGKVIRAKNYVGIIQLKNGVLIQILPKIHGSTSIDTKKTFLKMLKSLKNFPTKIFNEANLNTERMNLFEIFIRFYIQEIQMLLKKGMKSAYYEVENNLGVYKGKMLFSQQIKHNTVHKERFYVRYDEFGLNRAENRLIKSTLMKLLKQSISADNVKEIRKLLVNFELVEPSKNYDKDFASVKIDRNTKDYESIITWSKVFLYNRSFTTFEGNSFGKALLFQMDKVFEAYVSHNLKKYIASEWEVSLQDKGYYLFEKRFALRPDIVLRHQNESRIIIIDTKWKVLTNTPNNNYGTSQGDMYQMYAYAKKYETNEIWLIYPMNDEMENGQDIQFNSDDGVQVKVFLLDCHQIESSLLHLISQF
ncbi:McrC family protein [Peribacillus sp. NPDC096448]|uniref:McrC family protein n=1 Tax=Peribacillus sp. NPDC096448 TaxID=3364395 RepID=UPI00381BB773